ncbi:MAG: STAS domain-containing protein [Oscillospiraceae bacterium]|nr:STAS domain-containing protein [Oscillospiraceae bacterium]
MHALEISLDKKNNEIIFNISGKIDTQTSPKLQEIIDSEFNSEIKKVTIDLRFVNYISSAGLRVLFYLQKQMVKKNLEDNMEIINVNPGVKEIFDITGFSDFLKIKIIDI